MSTRPAAKTRAILLDVDGTLVDSNESHARAWVEAFEEAGVDVPFDQVRRAIGMGGDKLMPAVSGISEESPQGRQISTRRGEIFRSKYLPSLTALPGSRALAMELKRRGFTLVAASSASRDELSKLLRIAGVDDLLEGRTSSDDADESKPAPDIIEAALQRAHATPQEAVLIGDTPYDVEAGERAGVPTIGFRSGGWNDEGLRGAIAIYDGPADLLTHLHASPVAQTDTGAHR